MGSGLQSPSAFIDAKERERVSLDPKGLKDWRIFLDLIPRWQRDTEGNFSCKVIKLRRTSLIVTAAVSGVVIILRAVII